MSRVESGVLAALLPAGVECAEGDPSALGTSEGLFDAELAAIAKAVRSRREQYAATRHLARHVYARLGVAAQPLVNRKDRSPIWPEGYLGALTHTEGFCGVAVASERTLRGVGIDAERSQPLEAGVADHVLTEQEQRRLRQAGHDPLQLGALWFSAKESVYKAVFPTLQRFVGFREVEIHVQLETGTFSAVAVAPTLSDDHAGLVAALQGRFVEQGGLWITSAVLPHGEQR